MVPTLLPECHRWTKTKQSPRAIWTETLLDMLDKAVRQQRDDKSREIIEEIRDRGYAKAEVLRLAQTNFRQPDADRVERLIASISGVQRKAG